MLYGYVTNGMECWKHIHPYYILLYNSIIYYSGFSFQISDSFGSMCPVDTFTCIFTLPIAWIFFWFNFQRLLPIISIIHYTYTQREIFNITRGYLIIHPNVINHLLLLIDSHQYIHHTGSIFLIHIWMIAIHFWKIDASFS